MNVVWCCFNVVILGVCTAVAREMKQLRTTVRISIVTPVTAQTARRAAGCGRDYRHVQRRHQHPLQRTMEPGEHGGAPCIPAPVRHHRVARDGGLLGGIVLRVHFENLTIAEQEVLTMVLYSRADSWLGWGESRESDNVLRSLGRIFQISMHGLVIDIPEPVHRQG